MGKKQKPKPRRKRKPRQQQRHKEKESQHQEESLPADIVYEILIRNPIKTLSKFRCVCKQWGSIISQPSFQEDHHRRSSGANPFVLLTRCKFNGCEFDEDDETKTNSLHISTYNSEGTLINKFSKGDLHLCSYIPIQSCRGLVCLGPKYSRHPILICNPSTEEIITLPSTQGKHICIGFGYTATTNEFKVFRFFRHPKFYETQVCCEVFTLGTSSWRETKNPPPQYPPNFLAWGAPFLHGALHMLAVCISNTDYAHVSIDVLDIEKETYTKIPLPEYSRTFEITSLREMHLKEFEGSLCLFLDFGKVLEFWYLRNYKNREWVKKYSISRHSLGYNFYVDPLMVLVDGTMMLNIEVEDEEEALYYYNFRDQSLTKDPRMQCWGTLYVESFVAPGQ